MIATEVTIDSPDFGHLGPMVAATEQVSHRSLPPLPHTTPHTLRRTYTSIALLANRFDVL